MDGQHPFHEDFYLHKLKKNRVALVRDIIPDSIVDHLLAEDIISQEECESVLYCNQTTAGRNRKLLDIVSTKGPKGFVEFRNALIADFQWIVELLDNTAPPGETVSNQTSDVTDADIDAVVHSLLTTGSLASWKFVARKLGIAEEKINEIEYRSPRDIKCQIYDMLMLWRLENGHRAKHDILCQILTEEGRLATAEVIRSHHSASSIKSERPCSD